MATPHFEAAYRADEVRGPVPVASGERTIASGAYERYLLTHRPAWLRVVNTGPYDVTVYFSDASHTAGLGHPLLAGQEFRELVETDVVIVANASSGSATVAVTAGLTREPSDDMPALSTSNSFPAFDASDTHAIQLGVE